MLKYTFTALCSARQTSGTGSLSGFARDLGCSETDVQDAFSYWQEKGLVVIQTKPMFAVFYQNVKNALPEDASVYTDAAYNAQLQTLFAPKIVNPAELVRIYDWTDVFSIEKEAVPLLVQYGQSKLSNLEKASARGR